MFDIGVMLLATSLNARPFPHGAVLLLPGDSKQGLQSLSRQPVSTRLKV